MLFEFAHFGGVFELGLGLRERSARQEKVRHFAFVEAPLSGYHPSQFSSALIWLRDTPQLRAAA
jgi:hypothetical protein